MENIEGTPVEEPPAEAPKAPKVRRARQSSRLTDASGAELEVVAEELKNGTFQAFAKHKVRNAEGKTDAELSKGRGAVSQHATFDEAKAASTAIVQAAQKAGWKLKVSASGPAAKSNFDLASLPKPKK